MKILALLVLVLTTFLSCTGAVNKIFAGKERTAHERYAEKIDKTPNGKQWVILSKDILQQGQSVKLPYQHSGYFPAGRPRALALEFSVKRGEQIYVELNAPDAVPSLLYADLFKENGEDAEHVYSADEASNLLSFEAPESGNYILRLQPQLESAVQYDLTIQTLPSLEFPVAGNKARVGSVWGDSRDNGARSHEGIDIFAAKLTPTIAAADGYISSVKEGGLGGKTVHLRVEGRPLSLYYAHLDKQLVEEGQYVKKGDTIGLVGNTGNARTTPPHLHFGIYTYGGAIDPLPFVQKKTQVQTKPINKDLTTPLQLTKSLAFRNNEIIAANAVLTPLAVTSTGYLAELADGRIVEAPFKSVKSITNKKI